MQLLRRHDAQEDEKENNGGQSAGAKKRQLE